ncbi:OLD family protein [Hymenobacter daeguensis]
MLVQIPSANNTNGTFAIETNSQPIVLIGANGSGKTKMGYFIEQHNERQNPVVRISAHRALNMPDHATLLSMEQAEDALKYGSPQGRNNPQHFKYSNQSPTVYLQNDYGHLLSALFAQENTRNANFVKLARSGANNNDGVPNSSIDTIVRIWQDILPHREIEFIDSRVKAKASGNAYQGKEMSDGERVSLYLIGHCLAAKANSIIIVDEPELHLHKSLMSNLWSQVESARQDCQFIYITHDLEFASSRTKATKIWVKSFSANSTWDWQIVPEVEEIPEELVLQIVGSRKPILFVEGEKGSYDYELFQYIFPQFTILPRGGGSKVIESTKALRGNASLHTIEAWGLVDRDYKTSEEIAGLEQNHIRVCDVAEVENLLLIPELIALVAKHQGYQDPTEFIDATTNFVITHLEREFEKEVSYTSSLEINYRLNAFNKKKLGLADIKQAVADLASTIDVDAIYERHRALYQRIIDTRDLRAALRHYTNKGLLPNMSNILHLGRGEYDKLIIRLLKTDKKAEIVAALQQYIPTVGTVSQLSAT